MLIDFFIVLCVLFWFPDICLSSFSILPLIKTENKDKKETFYLESRFGYL